MTPQDFREFTLRHRPMSFGFAMREAQLHALAATIPDELAVSMLQVQFHIRQGNIRPPEPAQPPKVVWKPRKARRSGSVARR